MASLGSLFTLWMLLQSLPIAAIWLVPLAVLGAMPGVGVYFLMKIVADECFPDQYDDHYDEYASLSESVRIVASGAD